MSGIDKFLGDTLVRMRKIAADAGHPEWVRDDVDIEALSRKLQQEYAKIYLAPDTSSAGDGLEAWINQNG